MFWLLIFPDSLQCIISAHFTNSNAGWTVQLLGGFWLNESKTWLFAAARSSLLWFCLWGLGQVYFTVMLDCLQRSWPLRWLFEDANAILFQILFVKDVESLRTILECLWCLWIHSGDLGERVAQHKSWKFAASFQQYLHCTGTDEKKLNHVPFSNTCFVEGPIKRIELYPSLDFTNV